jgi:RND family efflux transporter MFP subunit
MTRVMWNDGRHIGIERGFAMPQLFKRHLIGASVAVLLVGAGLESCNRAQAQGPTPPPPTVTVATPLVRSEADWSEQSGRFVAAQMVDVRPRISGYLAAVHFKDGQYVEKGQLLFTIDPLPFQARADRARADLAQAEARLDRTRSELTRAETLRAADAISTEEYDSRKEAQAGAVAAKAAAQAALQSETLDLGYTRVYAPISGRISDRRVDPGNLVANGETVLTQIVSVDPIHFEFSAPGGALPPQLESKSLKALVKLEGETAFSHSGQIDFVDNRIDVGTGAIRGRVVLANPDGAFTPGQFGRVRVLFGSPKPMVFVPDAAIGSDQSRKFVLVVGKTGVVESRQIEVGPQVGDLRVVRSGLGPDDRVVVRGVQLARPGQTVKTVAGAITDRSSASIASTAAPQG